MYPEQEGNWAITGGDKTSLPIVTGVTGNDGSSKSVIPSFANPGGTSATDYLPSEISLTGASSTGVTTSYTGATRVYNSMGAYDYAITPIVAANATLGTSFSCYATMKEAFDAINAGTHQGVIALSLSGNPIESVSAVLNASGSGSSSYTSVSVSPTTSGLSISGNVANNPLIDLNGADNVTIDGRVNATGSTVGLVISNSSTSASNTSTIRFINDATNNTIKYCKIQGSATNSAAGVIFFSTCTSGNNSNLVDHNEITCAADASRPLNAIYSYGSSNSSANSLNTISNNNFDNFLSRSTASNGIYLSSYTSGWSITGNSFYETASFVPTASVAYHIIYINNTSGTNFTVSNNYIGGSGAACSGTWTKTSAFDNTFYSIYLNAGTGTLSNVQGNTISSFAYSNSSSASWYGIYQNAGDMNTGTSSGNTIGQSTGTGSITFTGGATGASLYGIYANSAGISDIEKNVIGSVTTASTNASFATNFYGIYKASAAGTTTISNNTIGSTSSANSINASSASSSNTQTVSAIYSAGTGTVIIGNNIIANLANGTTNTSTGTPGQVSGINISSGANTVSGNSVHDLTIANANNATSSALDAAGLIISTGTAAAQTISGNEVYNISNSYSSFAGTVAGIYYYGPNTASTVSKNHIYGLTVNSGSTSARINGISIAAGNTTYSNNIISLGGNTTTTLNGLYEAGSSGSSNIYFNTVYLGGTPASGSLNSACLYNAAVSSTRNFRDNTFNNARSSASGKNYALYIQAAGGTLTCDYNDYFVSGTGGTLGYYGTDKTILPIVSSQDAHSLATNPNFANPGGTNATDYLPFASLGGTSIPGITTDYFGTTRSLTPEMGAIEASLSASAGVVANVVCYGGSTGAVSVTVSGGTSPYTYAWSSSPVQTTQTATGLTAGTYTVTVTDANSFSATSSATVTQPSTALTAVASVVNNVSIYLGSDGSATVTPVGGTSPWSYSWSTTPAQTGQMATSLTAGTYWVTVTDANSCTATSSTTITQPTPPSGQVTDLIFSNVGGNQFRVDWTRGNGDGCAVFVLQGTTGLAPPLNNTSYPANSVFGNPASEIGLTGWYCVYDGAGTTVTVTGLSPSTNYRVHVCEYELGSITYNTDAANYNPLNNTTESGLTAIASVITDVTCFGGSDGSVNVSASGGYPSYTYEWSTIPTQTTQAVSSLTAGTFTVTVTDGIGETIISSATVIQPELLTVSAEVTSNVSCFGGSNGQINVSVSGGTEPYSYLWSGGSTNSSISNLSAGIYSVTVTDAHSCKATSSATVTEPSAALTANSGVAHIVTCNGGADGSVDVTVSGGTTDYSYVWSTIPVQTTHLATGLTAGTYMVTVTDAHSCTTTSSATLTQPPKIVPGLTGPATVCQNSTDNVYTTESGMSNYHWVVSPGGIITAGGTTSDNLVTITWNESGAKSVSVNYTTPAGCTADEPSIKNVSVSPSPTPVISGPAVVNQGETATYSTPFVAGHLYNWKVVFATFVPCGPGCITVHWDYYCDITVPGQVTVTETIPETGCSKTVTLLITIN